MKKETIKYEEVDGYKIIVGFDYLPTDTKASIAAADKEVEKLDEFKDRTKKHQEVIQHLQDINTANNNGVNLINAIAKEQEKGEDADQRLIDQYKKDYEKQDRFYKRSNANRDICNDELIEINDALRVKEKDVRREVLVYAEPRLNEFITDKFAEHIKAFYGKSENEQIVIDLEEDSISVIEDFRGCQYFYHDGSEWIESEIIDKLGVSKNTVVVDEYQDQACNWDQMEPEYKEQFRIQKLTADEKAIEFESKKDGLAGQAAIMERKLVIQGETAKNALSQAQAWYNGELDILKPLYNVA